jgi:hypothetical protein
MSLLEIDMTGNTTDAFPDNLNVSPRLDAATLIQDRDPVAYLQPDFGCRGPESQELKTRQLPVYCAPRRGRADSPDRGRVTRAAGGTGRHRRPLG